MDLRQLEYFVTTGRLENITRAAEQLFVSQPNITMSIRKLEQELGIQLFERKQKQFSLTAEGKLYLERIEPALWMIRNATSEVKDSQQQTSGTIVLGIPPMISSFIFAPILKHFRTLYPQRELAIIEEGSLGIRSRLMAGELDLGIVITDNASPMLEISPLVTCQHLLCMPSNHHLVQKETIDLEDLRHEPLILMKNDSYHRRHILQECAKRNFSPNIVLSSNQIQTNIDLVAKGVGLSFLLDAAVLNTPDVVTRPMTEPFIVNVGLAWRQDKYLSYASRALIKFVKDFSATHFKAL
ncbi:LysR family transcriptional regulator [Sporomusa sp.]|uniref:LysR family transcriptional regulator n=1 Tax=Sporomusa sp. TaxID=2078658 RepID=UPI002BE94C26|nr:LysR family transcriptional regulator [Sporomusa sp.]HWR42059.1 LysR family transcriptional regulator [Sporomusa sp.]